jgi:hypothetical protein
MTPLLAAAFVVGIVAALVALTAVLDRLAGPDPDLRPGGWSADDREPPCRCGMRVHPRRHRYHESSRWQERGERGL